VEDPKMEMEKKTKRGKDNRRRIWKIMIKAQEPEMGTKAWEPGSWAIPSHSIDRRAKTLLILQSMPLKNFARKKAGL
jgi:hypothetical protein